MERPYNDGSEDFDVVLFTGIEIEHSPAHGLKTLFVVGHEHDERNIVDIAINLGCEHIYLGANMSFEVLDPDETHYQLSVENWYKLISACLASGLWVTLDYQPKYSHAITNTTYPEHEKFISMISVRMPNVMHYGKNACIKIDDADFNYSNPGVWVHPLENVLDPERMTTWDQYEKDDPIKW